MNLNLKVSNIILVLKLKSANINHKSGKVPTIFMLYAPAGLA